MYFFPRRSFKLSIAYYSWVITALSIVARRRWAAYAISKIIIPSVYNEWRNGFPDWIVDDSIKVKYNFSTFVYQKLDPQQPNYIGNRGSESGVFLKFVVDHYFDFPDIAVREIHANQYDVDYPTQCLTF